MKQRLLLAAFILLSISIYSQQGPPPPCGIGYTLEACDADEDGFTQFKLTDANEYLFCSRVESDYETPKFYTDAAHTIQISNYENYINTSNPQTIYATAVNISSGETITLNEFDIEAKLLVYNVTRLTKCGTNNGSLATFDLTSAISFCGSNSPNDYSIAYYVSQDDANNRVNQIVNPASYVSATGIIYMVITNSNTGDFQHNSFSVVVNSVSISSISDLQICENDLDGFTDIDLTVKDSEILNGQSGIEVYYFETESDALNNVNAIDKNVPYQNITNPQTIYTRLENSLGCYNTGSFDINVLPSPIINQPAPYEVCDDDKDGLAVFDLLSKDVEILGDLQGVTISYHESEADAVSKINHLPSFYYVSFSNTIYVRVESIITGCASITFLDLIVHDCSTKGVIKINAFYDENSNSSLESDELNFLNGRLTYEINNDGNQHVLYSSNGVFTIISDDGNNVYDFSYEIISEYDSCYNLTTNSFENVQVNIGDIAIYNFPITKIQDCGDIAVYLVSHVPPRPGFDYINYLIIQNKGLENVSSGLVEFVHDASITLNSVENVDAGNTVTNTATGFTLDFVDLAPNQQETVLVDMNVPVSTSLGALLTNTATYSVNDLSIENNTSTLSEVVVGSYDPNDILESHGSEIFYDDFSNDDYLYYTIRFQNVGTADAINVSIDNTLDSSLDESTIQMLSSSHSNVFTRTSNQLNWKFDNIHLPSEDMDEPNSHGYVYYKIKPLAGYKVGDIIPNTAEIYFDFNPAVITNTFQTEFVATLSNGELHTNDFSIFPNPATNRVELKFKKSFGDNVEIKIYDIQGKMILNSKNKIQDNAVQLNVSRLKSGLYFLKVNNGILENTQKLIIN